MFPRLAIGLVNCQTDDTKKGDPARDEAAI
jgi:hypothetical protein